MTRRLKLIWASLNLERSDLLSEIHYPLSMVQAIAVVWTHAGLRSNEIMRLDKRCAHPQTNDVVHEDGTIVPAKLYAISIFLPARRSKLSSNL